MADLLLCQDVFLLAHDEESGKNRQAGLAGALGAALLLDLAAHGAIGVADGTVTATGSATGDDLLDRAAAVIAGEPQPRRVDHWLTALPKALKPVEQTVGASLVTLGVLDEQRGKALGLFDRTRWPERDPEPEQALRSELFGVLVENAAPTPRDLLLTCLLHQHGMTDGLVDKDDRRQARQRAKELAEQAESSDELSGAVGDSVRATMAAVMIATTAAATTAATTAAANS